MLTFLKSKHIYKTFPFEHGCAPAVLPSSWRSFEQQFHYFDRSRFFGGGLDFLCKLKDAVDLARWFAGLPGRIRVECGTVLARVRRNALATGGDSRQASVGLTVSLGHKVGGGGVSVPHWPACCRLSVAQRHCLYNGAAKDDNK